MSKTDRPATSRIGSDIADGIRRGLVMGAAALCVLLPFSDRRTSSVEPIESSGAKPSASISVTHNPALAVARQLPAAPSIRFADFGQQTPSADMRHVADWVADSRDNRGMAFVIVDKKNTAVFVFDADAKLRAATPVLLGGARGDDSVPGIGSRPIDQVRPEERTTPAGRFIGERGTNAIGEDVVWVDYDAAVSMHRVRTTNPAEHRLERLATPTTSDNRISYGCINMPVAFYETYIRPTFATQRAVVYVLPDVKPVAQVFGSYDVAAMHGISREVARAGSAKTASL